MEQQSSENGQMGFRRLFLHVSKTNKQTNKQVPCVEHKGSRKPAHLRGLPHPSLPVSHLQTDKAAISELGWAGGLGRFNELEYVSASFTLPSFLGRPCFRF